MTTNRLIDDCDREIARALGGELVESRVVGGGCIHRARRLRLADGKLLFVKSGTGGAAEWLAAEGRGLGLLVPHVRVPRVCGEGTLAGGGRWLALEWLDLAPLNDASWEDLGRQLAGLHGVVADRHGLDHDNFIGATPQANRWTASWPEFFLERRIRPQLALARRNGHAVPEAEACRLVGSALAGHEPPASLLHGDLWSGNAAALAGGGAVMFDPAPYHGDGETDLAMLELFGGPLPGCFFRGYSPPAADRERRRPVYDLYHALNHLNLFGGGYAGMVRKALEAAR